MLSAYKTSAESAEGLPLQESVLKADLEPADTVLRTAQDNSGAVSTDQPEALREQNFGNHAGKRTELLQLRVQIEAPTDQATARRTVSDGEPADAAGFVPTIDDLRPKISPGRGLPFVSYVPDDLVALCSSGGGIRSAIFNLGVLQGLEKIGLLPLIDYHSTVSGGGYVGGWWTTWRANNQESCRLMPAVDNHLVESADIRRLRERARFLSPTGFALSGEFWAGVAEWGIGLVGTLVMACSVITFVLFLWALSRVLLQVAWLGHHSHISVLAAIGMTLIAVSIVARASINRRVRTAGIAVLLLAAVTCVLDGLWATALFVRSESFIATLSSVAFGGIGAWVVRWAAGWMASREETKSRDSVVVWLSRFIPQILSAAVIAVIAFLLMLAEVTLSWRSALISQWVAPSWAGPLLAFLVMVGCAVAGHLLVGVPSTLHRFYRRRIEESFLHRVQDESAPITQSWPSRVSRPVHIVNCCASDTCYTTTDQMDRRGVNVGLSSIGAYPFGRGVADGLEKPTLSAAITASAAAVDPSMGFYSAKLGRLVAFLLFAFNFRLGIWWRPSRKAAWQEDPWRKWKQYLLNRCSLRSWREMLSQISLPTQAPDANQADDATDKLDVRLTDGGHFDNLGAYEMIRRRVRYVVICDGGADPGCHFAELSNLQRLVRRDFGVEIEIDLDTLRSSANGASQRHLAVGKIRYPGPEGGSQRFSDSGVLIYVKPALTGDEPEDVTQYQAASRDFPHETTTDQFFDDNQWEAYRKLGEHSVTSDLAFAGKYFEKWKKTGPSNAARFFDAAVRELGSEDHKVRTTGSHNALNVDALSATKPEFLDELLGELAVLGEAGLERAKGSLRSIINALDAQEQAFYRCDLDRHGDHLENWGLENRTDRLVASTEIRRWWPVIASLYSIPFRNRYLGERYGLNALLPFIDRGKVTITVAQLPSAGSNEAQPQSIDRVLRVRDGLTPIGEQFLMHATWPMYDKSLDLGSLAFSFVKEHETVLIGIDDLQVAPGYWSVGVNVVLIDALLDWLGFEFDAAIGRSKPSIVDDGCEGVRGRVRSIIVQPPSATSSVVQRPDQRHNWIGRGFIQTRSGTLIRDQKQLAKAGLFFSG